MREATRDLWAYVAPGAVLCVTTNPDRNLRGEAIMGLGCAKEAKLRFPGITKRIGDMIGEHGNRCMRFRMRDNIIGDWWLVTFPVKHHWEEDADPMLIAESADQLVEMADKFGWPEVILPRPGCGNGQLDWVDVRELLQDVLDDRFVVVTK